METNMNTLQPMQETDATEYEVVEVKQAEMLGAMTRNEIDIQIATAKQYPRNLSNVLKDIETLATMDEETANSCFYMLRRQGKLIEGPSVRMAEIVASSWGNIRVQSRIIGNDGKMITAQGICMDLEKNVAFSSEVKRRITDKYGKTFSDDMQVVTGNAACALAFRNAVLKVVPAALIKNVMKKAKKVAIGESVSLETTRFKIVEHFKKLGVDEQHLFDYLSISKIEEMDTDMVVELRSLVTALKDGTTTIEETFFPKKANEAEPTTQEVNPADDFMVKPEAPAPKKGEKA